MCTRICTMIPGFGGEIAVPLSRVCACNSGCIYVRVRAQYYVRLLLLLLPARRALRNLNSVCAG